MAASGVISYPFYWKAVAVTFRRGIRKNEKMLILFKNCGSVKRAYDLGFPLEKLQLGGLEMARTIDDFQELSLNEGSGKASGHTGQGVEIAFR